MAGEAGAGSGGGGGGEMSPVTSPKNRVKFLCSHGGKILPRSVDGLLKYVGGETRVVAVPRDVNISELMKKLSTMNEGDMVLKYQLIPEDLESLVSVRTDEDLKHMLEEYDRHEVEGNPKLRAFLFPSNPVIHETQATPVDPQAVEQRYIDAVNGIVRSPSSWKLSPINASRSPLSVSSACSSPKSNSPDGVAVETLPPELIFMDGYQNSRLPMHRVQSTPSLCSYNGLVHQSNNGCTHHVYQHPHHLYQSPQHHLHLQAHRSPPLPLTQSPPAVPLGQTEFARAAPMGHGQQHPIYSRSHSTNRSLLRLGSCNKYACCDEPLYGIKRPSNNIAGSLPHSPKKSNMQEKKGSIEHADQLSG